MLYQKSKAKDIIHRKEDLDQIVAKTINKMATVAGRTLGPGGRCVLIDRGDLSPLITKDGVTVIKSLGISSAERNIVLDAAKEISIGTAKEAGDGTTTAIVLADALVQAGHKFLQDNPKCNPQRFISELNQAYEKVIVPYLKNNAVTVENEDALRNVAYISSNGDQVIADAVVQAVMDAGEDGKVLIHESTDNELRVENVDGFVVTTGLKDLGQIGPVFINDKANQQVNLDNGHVVLYDGALNDLSVPAKIQDALANAEGLTDGRPILVFAHAFADNVLDMFAKTTKQGVHVVPIKTPRSGLPNGASMFLHDMAAYSGGDVYDIGLVNGICATGIGSFEHAKINMYETFVIGSPDDEDVEDRVQELKSIMSHAPAEMDKSHLRAAIAKLTGGISTIWVGGTSELEIREKKDRVEDAVEAVRSAIAEGIIPGGGVTMLVLANLLSRSDLRQDSWDVLISALQAPFRLLMDNCGENVEDVYTPLSTIISKENNLPKTVFDAANYKFVDPFEKGIIEPAKVVRVAVNNALSVAGLLITLGGIVVAPRDAALEAQLEATQASFNSTHHVLE